jgi:hypothetical protein
MGSAAEVNRSTKGGCITISWQAARVLWTACGAGVPPAPEAAETAAPQLRYPPAGESRLSLPEI